MQTIEKNINPDKFMWITKTKSYNAGTAAQDVVLSVGAGSLNKKTGVRAADRVTITFHNYAAKRISNSAYIMFGLDGDRLYFAEAEQSNGYKLTSDTDFRIAVTQVTSDVFVEWVRKHIGGYTLHQDVKSGLYYVDTGRTN